MDRNSSKNEADSQPSEDEAAGSDPLPFEIPSHGEGGLVSSLDDRPDLAEQVEALLEADPDRRSDPPASDRGAGLDESSASTPVLVVQSPKGTMETRHRVDSERFLLGRKTCDLVIEDPFVSNWHAQLFRRDDALVLQDLESQNGVFLRIADDLMLEDGDEIIVGQQRLVFRIGLAESEADADDGPELLGAPIPEGPAHLVRHLEGGQTAGAHPLSKETTIGDTSADLSFENDPLLSSIHAVIRRTDDGFALRDADSQTGTFIRIADAVELIDGDCFLIGRTRIRLTGV